MTLADWFLAPSLEELRKEVNSKYPKRDKSSDGTIGDPRHQGESYSDHNPCWSCTGKMDGVVRGLDLDNNGKAGEKTPLVEDVLKATIGDPRVWYVIWDGKIYSRTFGWQARVYQGDPHTNHVHISLQGHNLSDEDGAAAQAAVFSTEKWLTTKKDPIKVLPAVSVESSRNAFRHPRKSTNPVSTRRIQRALNARLGANLPIDGIFGRKTREAYTRWEKRINIKVPNGMPGPQSLTKLGVGRFRVVK